MYELSRHDHERRAHNRFDRVRASTVPAVRVVREMRLLHHCKRVDTVVVCPRANGFDKTADWCGGGCLHPSPRQPS